MGSCVAEVALILLGDGGRHDTSLANIRFLTQGEWDWEGALAAHV